MHNSVNYKREAISNFDQYNNDDSEDDEFDKQTTQNKNKL